MLDVPFQKIAPFWVHALVNSSVPEPFIITEDTGAGPKIGICDTIVLFEVLIL
jgi:hypothetical protein